jgi:tetratricopeptide (TPR) repeat protein
MPEDDERRPQALFVDLNAAWMLGVTTVEQHLATRDAFQARGDLSAVAMVETMLARLYWLRGDHETYEEQGLRIMVLAAELPPSATKARILAARARLLQLSGRSQEGLELAREALPIAEDTGEPSLISRILNTIGMARVHLGDEGGLTDLERSVAVAETARLPDDLHTALNNLANMYWRLGRLDEAKARHEEARQADEQYGYEAGLHWLIAEGLFDHVLRGEWNEALPLADAVLAGDDPVTSYLHVPAWLMRSEIEAGRNQRAPALADSEQALESARQSRDAQQLGPAILARAFVLAVVGRHQDAGELVDELLKTGDLADPWLHELPLLLADMGRESDYIAAVEPDPRRTPWVKAGLAVSKGSYAEAAEIYGSIGARVAQAWARLLLAASLQESGRESMAGAELDAAMEWFRSIEADYFLGRCDALLRASA